MSLTRFAARLLRLEGYDVQVETDGRAGLAAIRSEPPNLVLLDLRLPGFDGWQILSALQADPSLRRIPVLVLTASADTVTEQRARDSGAVDVLAIPISASELSRRVARVVRANGPS